MQNVGESPEAVIFIVRNFITTDTFLLFFRLFCYEFEASKSVARSVNVIANVDDSLKIPLKIRLN